MIQSDKLRNLTIIPGMEDLIGSMGIEVLNDIADSHSDMYEALKAALVHIEFVENKEPMGMKELDDMKKALAKADGKS